MNYLAFKKFLAAAGLSTRRFADACGVGKTTVHRLAQAGHGGLTPAYVKTITPAIMRACREHLAGTNASADAAHLILADIFGEDFIPSSTQKAVLTPEMLRFFRFARDPFAPPRRLEDVFLTPEIGQILALLEDAVRYQGFVCVVAPVGAGKTVIKNLLSSRAERRSAGDPPAVVGATRSHPYAVRGGMSQNPKSAIPNPKSIILSPQFADMSRVTAAGIVIYILEAFRLKPRRSLLLAQRQLEDHLAQLAQNGISVALCFDECHRLADATLTALKNFYELGSGGFERYLGLVLFGQPQILERLKLPRFREIAERLAVHHLPAFSAGDTENYLAHCLQKALPNGPQPAGPPTPASPRSRVAEVPGTSLNIDSAHLGPAARDLGPTSNPQSQCGNQERSEGAPDVSPYECGNANGSERVIDLDSGDSQNPQSQIPDPKLFAPGAVRLIAARASTPLAIANLAAAALTEAYKKGEPRVLARFVPAEETGPRAIRVGR